MHIKCALNAVAKHAFVFRAGKVPFDTVTYKK